MDINLGYAILLTTLTGLTTSIGSCIAFLIRRPNYSYLALLLGLSAGIMVYISSDENPTMAHRYGREHFVILGVVSGMAIMAISLCLLG